MKSPIFLKLGGSLITEKNKPAMPRLVVISRIASEIAQVFSTNPETRLILGHGSGSFGHVSAMKYGTRDGVRTQEEWAGFAQVWQDAAALNRVVMDALFKAGLPAIAFPVSSSGIASDGEIDSWETTPIKNALGADLLPVIYGDAVFDRIRGGTILSTEKLFAYLAEKITPQRILLAGIEAGIYSDFPKNSKLITLVTPKTFSQISAELQGSTGPDVTGGMATKVQLMLKLVEEFPDCEVTIFSGFDDGNVRRALSGERLGTQLAIA